MHYKFKADKSGRLGERMNHLSISETYDIMLNGGYCNLLYV